MTPARTDPPHPDRPRRGAGPEQTAAGERRHAPLLPGFDAMASRRQSLVDDLVARRIRMGLTQTEVAARMGTSQSAVARLEAGGSDARLSTVERYAAAVGQLVDWALADPDRPARDRPDTAPRAGGRPGVERADVAADGLPFMAGADDPATALLARRIVLAHGDLDGDAGSRLAATLMLLDASGDGRVLLRLTAATAGLDTALSLIDVIDVLGVPVDTVASGTLSGGAVGVFAAGRLRQMTAHARLHLRESDSTVAGRATEIERAVAADASRRDEYRAALSRYTGRRPEEISVEWDAGQVLDPPDAVTLGYADTVLA